MNTAHRITKILVIFLTGLLVSACGDGSSSFSLLADSDSFQQSTSTLNTKVDILWVIDNSGSMATSQQQLANNFSAFIDDFSSKGYDYQMSVVTTEAYRSAFGANSSITRFRDRNATQVSGVYVMTPSTVNIENVFLINITQGISGNGDERAFHSFRQALDHPVNSPYNFLRPDSFLQVVIVSDEDDFSHSQSTFNESYSNPNLYSINSYVNYLDAKTGTTGDNRRYAVSAIAVFDTACQNQLSTDGFQRKIGVRYGQLVDQTPEYGIKGSLCSNFAQTLQQLAEKTIQGATQFPLSRLPIPSTINVFVNSIQIPACYVDSVNGLPTPLASGTTGPNPAGCGFTYNEAANSVVFSPGYTPAQGASIYVGYDPVGYGQ